MKRLRRSGMTSEINVTNLVDVSLTLVVIFILTAPLLKEGIEVNTPEAEASKSMEDISKAVMVSIKGDREIYVNEDVVEEQFVGDRVKVEYDLSNESPVLLSAEETLDYGYVIHVMDKIRAAGVTKLSLVTRPKQEGKQES